MTTNSSRLPASLSDLDLWDEASESEQDAAIDAVAGVLGDGYRWLETRPYQCGDQEHRIASFLLEARVPIELQLIPGGFHRVYEGFITESEEERRVSAFLLGRWPVIQEIWDAFDEQDHRRFVAPELPIEGLRLPAISCWLARVGAGLRLPTEAEWEHACWAGTARRFPWGDNVDERYYWYRANSGGRSQPPRLHADRSNAFGLVDIVGNVWELCAEGFGNGGCCDSHPYSFDVRAEVPASHVQANIGFRVARSLD